MLAVRPSPVPLWPKELPRGRSRQVSHVALARLASQERRAASQERRAASQERRVATLIPPSPTTTDYYDSPPSPPRSLEDQVHVAYAHDDIHLAKILLLRLKGIHVTGNDDPRIAEVKDEDFDFCFVPCGRLLDDEEEKTLEERQRAELERVEERRRAQRLKDCERIWEQGKKRLRELKALAVRRKELEEKRRATSELEPRTRPTPRHVPARPVVSYKLVVPAAPREQEPFVYDFMPQPATHSVSRPQTLSQPKSKSPFTRPLFDDSRSVPFSDVLTSMQGPLFPPEQRSATALSTSRGQDSQKRRDAELLESLLVVVESEEEERRRRKGKAPERPVPRRKDSGGTLVSPCPTCSSSSSLSSASSRRSWLSFSSASSSSVSTAATTPSSSPPSTLKPIPLTKTWFLAPRTPTVSRPCKCNTTHLAPVSPADAPLPVLPDATSPTPRTPSPTPADTADDAATSPATSLVLRRFAQLVDLARGFQHAYMSAAMFVVPPHPTARSARARAASTPRRLRTLHAPGARARPADVRAFLASPRPTDDTTLRPIPLRLLNADDDDAELDPATSPRTALPSPLPYALAFKPHPVPPRSPWRAVHGPAPEGSGVVRLRNVENPVYWRVRAVENAVKGVGAWVGIGGAIGSARSGFGYGRGYGMGMAYRFGGAGAGPGAGMGRPVVMEGSLACGREKVLRVAYEGIGRSRLRFEVVEGEVGVGPVPVPVPVAVGVDGRGRGRRRGQGRGRVVDRMGDGDGDEEGDGEWVRGGRRRAMWW